MFLFIIELLSFGTFWVPRLTFEYKPEIIFFELPAERRPLEAILEFHTADCATREVESTCGGAGAMGGWMLVDAEANERLAEGKSACKPVNGGRADIRSL